MIRVGLEYYTPGGRGPARVARRCGGDAGEEAGTVEVLRQVPPQAGVLPHLRRGIRPGKSQAGLRLWRGHSRGKVAPLRPWSPEEDLRHPLLLTPPGDHFGDLDLLLLIK